MRRSHLTAFIVVAAALATAACASSEEWATWKTHPTHFASGEHLTFSLANGGGAPRVRREDLVLARDEGWWGRPVTVGQEQILER